MAINYYKVITKMELKKLTEEHKKKIGLSNKNKIRTPEMRKNVSEGTKIAMKKYKEKLKMNPDYYLQKRASKTCREILKENNRKIDECQICKDKNNLHIHHINGNKSDNRIRNLCIICCFCHHSIHETKKRYTRMVETRMKDGSYIAWNKGLKMEEAILK